MRRSTGGTFWRRTIRPGACAALAALACLHAGPTSPDAAIERDAGGLPRVDLSTLPPSIRGEIQAAAARAAASPGDAAAAGDLGMLYLVYDLPEAGMICFDRAATLQRDAHRWAYLLGMARESAGDATGAIAALRRALELSPSDVATLVRLGTLLVENEPAMASELFRKALAADPGNARAHAGLGRAARAAGRTDEALQHYEAALRSAPDFAEAHYAIAMILAARGETVGAREHLKAHAAGGEPPLGDDPLALEVARTGRNTSVLRREATALARRGDVDGAIALLSTALEYDVSGTATRQHLGLLLAQQGRFPEAARHLEQVVAADPGNVEARSMLGLALFEMGRLEEAEAQYREALRRHPDHAPTLIYFSRLLGRTHRLEEAVDSARRAVEAQPANPTYRFSYVELLAISGRGAEAIEQARRLTAQAPANAAARQMLATLLARAGDPKGAEAEWAEAARLDPRLPEPHAFLAQAALARGEAGQAVREAEAACSLTGFQVKRHLDLLAAAYEAAGRGPDASRVREQASRLPADPPR